MYILNEDDINNLPIHDSAFVEYRVSQNEHGDTDFILKAVLLKEELVDIDIEIKKEIKLNGEATFLFKNCRMVNIKTISNSTRRDSIDYIAFEHNEKMPEIFRDQKLKQYSAVFISGSKIECIAEDIALA